MPTGIYIRTKEMKTGKHMLGRKLPKEVVEKIKFANTGDKNWRWGMYNTNAKYRAIHGWVARRKGKPNRCEHCGNDNLIGRKIGWANKDHKYKRNLNDWVRLCVVCHRRMDNKRWSKHNGQWYRKCNICNAILPKSKYYIRKNGVWIVPCKKCCKKIYMEPKEIEKIKKK